MAISFVGSATGSSSPNTATSVNIGSLTGGSDSAPSADDLVIAAFAVGDDDNTNTDVAAPTLTGVTFTEVADLSVTADGDDIDLAVFYGWYTGSDTTLDWAAVGGTDAANASVVMVFRGVRFGLGPFDVTSTTATGQDTAHPNPPEINTTGTAGLWTVIVGATSHISGGAVTYTFPSGYTTDAAQIAHDDSNDVTIGMGYNTAPADPENPAAMTHSATEATNSWAAVTMALVPAGAEPPAVANIAAWYDFSHAATVFEDTSRTDAAEADDLIAGVTDKSGNARHLSQATSGNRPLWKSSVQNGLSVARFVTDDQLTSTITLAQPLTVAVVFSPTSTTTYDTLFDSNGANAVQVYRDADTSNLLAIFAGGLVDSNTTYDSLVGTWSVLTAVFNGASSAMHLNTDSIASGNAGSNGFGDFSLGLDRSENSLTGMVGDIGEVLIYNKALGDTDRGTLETYLNEKWDAFETATASVFTIVTSGLP